MSAKIQNCFQMCHLNLKLFETVPHLKQINIIPCVSSLEISPDTERKRRIQNLKISFFLG